MKYRKKPVVIEAMRLPLLDEEVTEDLEIFLGKSDRRSQQHKEVKG